MPFEFLPDDKPPETKPNTEEGTGGKFKVGKNVFFDDYKHHLDAHALFSTPPKKEEFKLIHNFNEANWMFSDRTLDSQVRDNFFGAKTNLEDLKNGYTTFQDPKLLNSVLNKIDTEVSEDLFSGIEKPKMKINDRFGMFSFDLAAMAMTYVYEYYTVSGNKKVDANLVQKVDDHFINIKTYEVVKQVIKRRENGTPVVVSSVRNSLIDFDKQTKQNRSVEIMITNSFAYKETASSIIYNSMAGIALAKNLLKKGFLVKLTSLLVIKNEGVKYFHFVPAKRFNQPLDINAAAYVCGDPRFFRYQGFKMFISGYDRVRVKTPNGLGPIVADKNIISKAVENDYVKNSDLKQADTRLYFGGSRSLSAAKREVLEAINLLNKKYGNDK